MSYFIILFFVFLIFLNRKDVWNNPLSPWNITIFVWVVVMLLYLMQNELLPLKDEFYYSIFLWVSGFYFTSKSMSKKNDSSYIVTEIRNDINHFTMKVYYLLVIVLLPLYSQAYLNQVGGFSLERLADIRQNAVEAEVHLGLLSYVPALCKALLLIELYRFKPNRIVQLIFAIFVNIIAAVVIMEKGYFGLIFITTTFFLYKKGYLNKKTILFSSVGFALLMVAFNAFRGGGTSADANVADFISLYCVSPSVAFCQLEPGASTQFGEHTFRFFYAIFHLLGIGPAAVSNWNEPVFVPIRTNVFTVMEPYYNDFGLFGVFVFSIIDGLIVGSLYRYYKTKRTVLNSCLYAYILYVLIFQFFQEYFFISLSATLQMAIIIYISTLFLKKKQRI